MTTSKRTTRGTSTIRSTGTAGRPDNGAPPLNAAPHNATPPAAPPSATPSKVRVRQRKSASASSRTTEAHMTADEAPRPAADRYASIAQAAYFRSQHRGFKPGHEMEDWLAAEAEVDQRLRGGDRMSGESPE